MNKPHAVNLRKAHRVKTSDKCAECQTGTPRLTTVSINRLPEQKNTLMRNKTRKSKLLKRRIKLETDSAVTKLSGK
jgi:hypothetical protein